MKRLVMFSCGLAAAALLSLSVLVHDVRLWWAWRREDRCARCRKPRGSSSDVVAGAASRRMSAATVS